MRARLLAATAALLLLPACGGTPSPAPAPYKTPTETSSSELVRSEATAREFIADYLAAFTDGARSGDTSRLHELATADCPSCRTLEQNIEDFYAKGGKSTGANYTAGKFSLASSVDAEPVVLEGVVNFARQTQIPSPGAEPRIAKGGPAQSRISLTWTSKGWRMSNWEYL